MGRRAPAASAVAGITLATALLAGIAGVAAYGLDFPQSSRRFARLA